MAKSLRRSEECRQDQACIDNSCVNPCVNACGTNANCKTVGHNPVCSCPTGYTGDPFTHCRVFNPEELCHPSPCGVNTKCTVRNNVPTCSCLPGFTKGSPLTGCHHECESDSECSSSQICENFKCTSACSKCGENAICSNVVNHRAVCNCPTNYIGDPHHKCRPECYTNSECPYNKPVCVMGGVCHNPCENACGAYANCELRQTTPVCSCPKHMTGNPLIACRVFEKRDLCDPNPCGLNAECKPGFDNIGNERPVCTCPKGYFGNALHKCTRGECFSDSECPNHLACSQYKCVDPCIGHPCGIQAICESREHKGVCTCPEGTKGDALVSCRQSRQYYGRNYLARYFYK
ncbi:neurogenic locus notch homolog protein 1-like [Ctenocephalides felis]|uniref:neurogenic locus notch homolog protein 1-like n=1 Tax=Ctenocephalides felis TaxID=7515 RepID=UPI000E6E441F|nr:neurogenic locus notch homolog protein 1-like [Ctenocephalides felis]